MGRRALPLIAALVGFALGFVIGATLADIGAQPDWDELAEARARG